MDRDEEIQGVTHFINLLKMKFHGEGDSFLPIAVAVSGKK